MFRTRSVRVRERSRDGIEDVHQILADVGDGSDDDDGDQGGDQAVLDSGNAGFVLREGNEHVLHVKLFQWLCREKSRQGGFRLWI